MSFNFPPTFSDLDDAPASEIALLVEKAAAEALPETLGDLTDLLLDRALRLLREGSRQEILDEALAVSRGVSSEAGRTLQQRSPETFGAWSALDDLLAEAARRADRAAIPSLLRSTQGHGLAILEVVAAEGRAVPRAEIRRRLNLGEAHLSHLLRDLEEADLIVRYRPQGSKEVHVELGPAGQAVVSQTVLPPWLERLAGALSDISEGSALDIASLAQRLEEAGAPSRLAADRVVEAVARLASAVTGAASRKEPAGQPVMHSNLPGSGKILQFVRKVADLPDAGTYHFQEMLDRQADQPARALFAAKTEPFQAIASRPAGSHG